MMCLDTYALVEIHDENPDYLRFTEMEFVVPDVLIAEFHGILYRRYNKKTADWWVERLGANIVDLPLTTYLKAVRFKVDHNTRKYSFFDCVGYVYAQEHDLEFVTGDTEFEGMPGVTFVG